FERFGAVKPKALNRGERRGRGESWNWGPGEYTERQFTTDGTDDHGFLLSSVPIREIRGPEFLERAGEKWDRRAHHPGSPPEKFAQKEQK
ncbi:MAG: hypothetical protein WD069_07715, partial [Planctomycetales bacterium]